MTIDEAIEILQRQHEGYTAYPKRPLGEAEKLAIEALKRVKWMRSTSSPYIPLPGETEKEKREEMKIEDLYKYGIGGLCTEGGLKEAIQDFIKEIDSHVLYPVDELGYDEKMATPLETDLTIGDWLKIKQEWEIKP